MVRGIESLCRVGIIHPMAYPEAGKGEGPVILESLAKLLKDEYFGAIEVTWMKDPAIRKEARAMAEWAGVELVFAGQPPLLSQKLNLNALDEAARKAAVDQCRQSVDMAYDLGARILAVLSGPDPGDADRDRATAALVDSLGQICAYAQEKADYYMLAVSLETFDRTIDKKCLVGPTTLAAQVAAAVKERYSNFGLTIDLSHQPILGETIHDMVIDSIDHLIHVHIGNAYAGDQASPAYGDQHPRFGFPGSANGVAELKRFIEALIYAGYFQKNTPTSKPVMSFEVKPLPGECPELVIAGAKRTLNQAWAEMQA